MKVLLVTEGSGGHLIPALQVANALAQTGARIKVWYATRPQTAPLVAALMGEAPHGSVEVDPLPIETTQNLLGRLWQCGQLWSKSQRCFDSFAPDVVVGFGGWVSAPVVLAACLRRADPIPFLRRACLSRPRRDGRQGRQVRRRRIGCLLHEQNVVMGRANHLLARWVDRVAVSFHETQATLNGTPSVVTGMPVRDTIGQSSTGQQASRFGLSDRRRTLLVLGGSQGSRSINRLVTRLVALLSPDERAQWQILHVTGSADEAMVKQVYAASQIASWVAPFLVDMAAAYAQADVVIARAGAATIAELARCGKPAILIPYPYAGGHQVKNARLVEMVGGGVVIAEHEATPERLVGAVRRLLDDERLQQMMGDHIRQLAMPDATQRMAQAVLDLHAMVLNRASFDCTQGARPESAEGRA